MSASTSGERSSSTFQHRRQSSHHSSSSSSSSLLNVPLIPIPPSSSSSATQFLGSGSAYTSRSVTPTRHLSDSMYTRGYEDRSPVDFASADDFIDESVDAPRQGADSISVTIRFRPLSEREYHRGDEIAWSPDGDTLVRNEYNLATAYAFDRVFGPSATSPEVYEVAARPVVKAAMDGINGTVFAYGVTSSGKTHTMHGDQASPGIIPLAIKDVFSIIQDTPGREFLLRVSYIEIYNEVINDLLDPTGQNLRVREDAQFSDYTTAEVDDRTIDCIAAYWELYFPETPFITVNAATGTYVEGIKEEVVMSPGHALSFIAAGEEHRHVGSNNFNLFSSRSHTIFTLMIESSDHGDEYDGVIFSQLNLIDLAGSESSKTETTGVRRKEGSYINKSLLTLGTVIGKLSEGRASHIPFRDSKLTRLLQSSLSGHGHVSLICTVTPASSNMEETHNTLKFASRAKCIEIYASRNKIIDEKSLIKKYQREISTLKEELDHLRKGMIAGVSHEEIIILRQQLEEGQVKMQSRLEEEEEAKAALMSRIQRLTKLILVSSKNKIPTLNDVPGHQRSHSAEDDKLEVLRDGLLFESENQKSSLSSNEFKHKRSSSKWTDDLSAAGSTVTELPNDGMTMSDEVDLLVEQVKMLADEIAFSTSTLKRLVEQSVNDPDGSKIQIQNMEREIQEKRNQIRVLEQRITENGEASVANSSLVDMQQTVMQLMTQVNQKSFELEIKSADNRVLQEQLHNKCAENKELQDRIASLQQHQASVEEGVPAKFLQDLKKKVQSQEIENEKLKIERVQILEENSALRVQNQNISEEASYAKELASAAAVELKNLAGEITKISLQNSKLEKELAAAKELAHSKSASMMNGNNRKHSDSYSRSGRRGRASGRPNGGYSVATYDDFDSWELDPSDMKMELQARKQREAALESALAEKEIVEDEYRKRVEEGKKRESALENDLANMWVLVAQLKKESVAAAAVVAAPSQLMITNDRTYQNVDVKAEETKINDNTVLKEMQVNDAIIKPAAQEISKEESLVVRLKARMQEMKEKELKYSGGNGDANSHVCKVCFESPTATMLLPCRHFCLCKSCSQACSECPICRTNITDRIFAFT